MHYKNPLEIREGFLFFKEQSEWNKKKIIGKLLAEN